MSYATNWGFTDPTDEFGASVPLYEYGSGPSSEEIFRFIIRLELSSVFKDIMNCYDINDRCCTLKIVSDYEPISSLLVTFSHRSEHIIQYILSTKIIKQANK